MTAPDLSPSERAVVERFDTAEPAPEALVERVARAIADSLGHKDPAWYFENYADIYRRYADAALAVLSGPSSDAERAVERVLALADEYAERSETVKDGFWRRHLWIVSQRLRAAVAGPPC